MSSLVEAGHRTAINLQGIEKEQINRGDMAATPGSMVASTLLDAEFHHLSSASRELKNRTQVRVHLGTREIVGRIVLLDGDRIASGKDASIQLILQEPVAVWPGDRYVIRSYSPVTTIGGGVILNNAPKKRKRTLEKDRTANRSLFAAYASGDIERKLLLQIEESGTQGITADLLASRTGVFGKKLKKLLLHPISTGAVLVVDSDSQRLLAAGVIEALHLKITDGVKHFHRSNPLKTGIVREELRSQLRPTVDQKLFSYLLAGLGKKGVLEQVEAEVKLAGHTVTLQVDEEEMERKIGTIYREAGLAPPNLKDVIASFGQFPEKQIRQVIDLLLGKGEIVRVNESLYFHTPAVEQLKTRVVDFIRKEGEIDALRFKELTGLTRKFSIPLLEHFDKIKLTIRIGDTRVLRKG